MLLSELNQPKKNQRGDAHEIHDFLDTSNEISGFKMQNNDITGLSGPNWNNLLSIY